MLLAEAIFDCTGKLAADTTASKRYSRATFGARMLMAFLEWRRENAEKADSPDAQRYGKILQEWISLKDYAYVIQFEPDYRNVAFLKAGAALALERETSPDRTNLLQCRSERYQTDAGKTEEALASTRFECGAISIRSGCRRFATASSPATRCPQNGRSAPNIARSAVGSSFTTTGAPATPFPIWRFN